METFIKPKRGGGKGGDFAIKRKFVASSNGGEIISGKRGGGEVFHGENR